MNTSSRVCHVEYYERDFCQTDGKPAETGLHRNARSGMVQSPDPQQGVRSHKQDHNKLPRGNFCLAGNKPTPPA